MEGRRRSEGIVDKEAPLVRNKNTERRLREILREYYELLAGDSPRHHQLKGRFNGYAEALLTLGQIDKSSLQAIIHNEHFQMFQMTKEARQNAVVGSTESWSDRDWAKLDEPTYIRRPLRCKRK